MAAATQARESLYGLRGNDLFARLARPTAVPIAPAWSQSTGVGSQAGVPVGAGPTGQTGDDWMQQHQMRSGFRNIGDLLTQMNTSFDTGFDAFGNRLSDFGGTLASNQRQVTSAFSSVQRAINAQRAAAAQQSAQLAAILRRLATPGI